MYQSGKPFLYSSWHLSISSAYFIAWVIVAIIFQRFIYNATNAGLFIVLYIVTGLSLASWTFIVAVPFASAPTLAAITCELSTPRKYAN
jgi:ATP-binding cassette subfamily A (ABC1) protein 3